MTTKSIILILFLTPTLHAVQFSSSTEKISPHQQRVSIQVILDENEAILANSLHASINHPKLSVEKPIINIPAIKKYVHEFGQKKQIYDKNFQATVTITAKNLLHPVDAMMDLSYLSTKNNTMLDLQIPVSFEYLVQQSDDNQVTHVDKVHALPKPVDTQNNASQKSLTAKLQNLVEQTKSPWAQILFALLLGLLLSLTPCIYPMIPITIGILHSQGRKSLLHDFLGSIAYACGLATTFACLGLLATLAGSSFGSLLSNTPFVIGLIMFIGYMSLTMIGIIDMYIPSFMKGQVKMYNNFGPFFASYLFGAISGTIASPCVSPGLALLLSIVATLGSTILGFLLLFAFGIGLSIPLIIIGTFSNSLYLLPKSGMWMVEIKKALGFFMFATCFYYLSNIAPTAVVYWLFSCFTGGMAIFYIKGTTDVNNHYKSLYTVIGIVMIGLTMLMTMKSYEKTFYNDAQTHTTSIDWQKNYTIALDHAQEMNKLLLVDFWAHHCTICKAIDKKVFHNEQFIRATSSLVTFVKIDATHSSNPDYLQLRDLYKVYAQPTILIVDPATQTVLKKWTSEPYSLSIEEFIQQIKELKK